MTPLPQINYEQTAVETDNLDDSVLDKIFESKRDTHRFRVPRIPPKIQGKLSVLEMNYHKNFSGKKIFFEIQAYSESP